MSEDTLLTIIFMFVVLCITVHNMHNNYLKHKYTKSQKGPSKKDIKKYGEWYHMTFYLDKVNKTLFIKLNTKTSTQEYNNLVEKITNYKLPYKVIILDHEDELVII